MKTNLRTDAMRMRVVMIGAALLLAGCGAVVAPVVAQEAPPAQPLGAMREQMQQMMGEQREMMEAMQMAEARLDGLVAAMNAASGDAKVEAMAAVVNALVEQHGQMRMGMMGMMSMQGRMMDGMMSMEGMMGGMRGGGAGR